MPSPRKEKATALSSYIGFPEHLMQKAGFYKHPFLFLVSVAVFHLIYYRTCQLDLDLATQSRVLAAIVTAIDRTYILCIVAGAIALLATFGMTWERLFINATAAA
ncbi:uncharacterized protein Aud_005860 [Aspergillus udagawae]|uniref:Uncharacterized protein n=1 Tax=Aspergillus udagawae TaxID=91492 RepID=A0A8E0QS38_9EURO|nr:uncharacterized protein Aud_005860 [Aspergillus udagawae]GIC89445.1 hypothetical protein Aud_005860 [Aspergillus udagawae]